MAKARVFEQNDHGLAVVDGFSLDLDWKMNFVLSDRVSRILVALAFLLGGAYVILSLFKDILAGGNSWKQGDWLINRELVEVRRGPLGSLILDLSDVIGTNPLFSVGALQAGLVIVLFAVAARLVLAVREPMCRWLLISSPAFFLLFWSADSQGSLRKELIVFLAILLAVAELGARPRLHLFLLACVLMVVGFYGHEANILFLPLFLGLTIWGAWQYPERRTHLVAAMIVTGFAFHALQYALVNAHPVDASNLVCRPLLDRGLTSRICNGAISFLNMETTTALATSVEQFATHGGAFLVSYAVAFLPFIYLVAHLRRPAPIWAVCVLLVLPFMPLYAVAVDWGRWMSFHAFAMVSVLLLAFRSGRAVLVRQPDPRVVLALLGLGLIWAPVHTVGIVKGGVVMRVVSAFW